MQETAEESKDYRDYRRLRNLQPSFQLNQTHKKTKKYPCQNRGTGVIYALSTLPDLKQEVHTYVFLAPPSAVLILTDLTLDFHILLDLLCE